MANYRTVAAALIQNGLKVEGDKLVKLPLTTKRNSNTPIEKTVNHATYAAFVFLNLLKAKVTRKQLCEYVTDPKKSTQLVEFLDANNVKQNVPQELLRHKRIGQLLGISQDARGLLEYLDSLGQVQKQPEVPFPEFGNDNEIEDFGDFSF